MTETSASTPTNKFHQSLIEIDNVSMVFNMASEQLNSLKEYAIALLKRELRFKEFRALDRISFTIEKGDVFGILGTNGSGKSTMLKIIAGVLEPTEGKCTVNGSIAPLIELGAGFDMELTARENIYLNGALLGYSKPFIAEHFDEIVEFAEVGQFLDMPLKNYSSGMVARIAFAIATAVIPDILIVDEVLSVGDFMFQKKCEDRISSLINDHGVTVLIVSHDNNQIERLCNKAAWIEKGHLRMIGDSERVCRTYRVLGGHAGSKESEKLVLEALECNQKKVAPFEQTDISAESRYGLAAKITERCFPEGSSTLVVVTGENDFDNAIAMGLAGALKAPVALLMSESIPDVTSQEIKRLSPKRIVLLSSSASFTERALLSLPALLDPSAAIETIAAETSSALSLEVLRYGEKEGLWANNYMIFSYVGCVGDLISLSPFTYQNGSPVVLCDADRNSTDMLAAVCDLARECIVLGGTVSYPDNVLEEMRRRGSTVTRLAGKDPYDANKIINGYLEDKISVYTDKKEIVVSSIKNPTDSYLAGIYADSVNGRILLEDPTNLDSVASGIRRIRDEQEKIARITFIGENNRFNELDKELLVKAAELPENTD